MSSNFVVGSDGLCSLAVDLPICESPPSCPRVCREINQKKPTKSSSGKSSGSSTPRKPPSLARERIATPCSSSMDSMPSTPITSGGGRYEVNVLPSLSCPVIDGPVKRTSSTSPCVTACSNSV